MSATSIYATPFFLPADFELIQGKLLLSTAETQRILSIGKTKLFELLAAGDLASITIGSRRLVVAASLHRLIAARV